MATDAGIDLSRVMRYFVSKAQPFDAALDIDLRLPDLAEVPLDELPQELVRLFLDRWESDPADDALLVLLRSAVTNDHAAARMREVFAEQVAPALATALGHDLAIRRAGLVAAQLLGLAPDPLPTATASRHGAFPGRGRTRTDPGHPGHPGTLLVQPTPLNPQTDDLVAPATAASGDRRRIPRGHVIDRARSVLLSNARRGVPNLIRSAFARGLPGNSFGDWWGNEGTPPDDGLDQGVVIANSPML